MFLIFLFLLIPLVHSATEVHVCDNTTADNWFIYCQGRILEAVNVLSLYNDSKTFVDMPMKDEPEVVQAEFEYTFGNKTAGEIDKAELQTFIDKWFRLWTVAKEEIPIRNMISDSPAGAELTTCVPVDYQEKPKKLERIQDPKLREWAYQLNNIWKTLCKKIHADIEVHRNRYSLIWIEHEFIAPGGRFLEFYYWDAYWIIKGLIATEMYTTVERMIENLGSMITRFGFIPNGGRIYYLKRSQPPMFSGMVYEYYEATGNKDFLRKMLPIMEKEHMFWDNKRMSTVLINNELFQVYQYKTEANVPRPESYREDTLTSQDVQDKQQLWQDLASAAEAGWDFSSRWFSDHKLLYNIETTKILPVDLNAIQCWNMDILEYLFERVGDKQKSELYREKRAAFRDVIHKVFYNGTAGSWYDYNLRTKRHNTNFYPSNAVPLFTGCYHSLNQGKSEKLFNLMKNSGVFDYPGGVPTSMAIGSEEQWDFPNGFSPLNHMIIEGLRKSENAQMQEQAFRLAEKWVFGNYKVFQETKYMWEKYNVIGNVSKPGTGGEYDVQDGFGWSNGVILDLLLTYHDRLSFGNQIPDDNGDDSTTSATRVARATTSSSPAGIPLPLPAILATTVWILIRQ